MAAQRCRAAAPNEPACDFWLGVALGHKARERPVTGLAAIPEMVEAFRKAAAAAPTLEEGGPDRALAFLYLRAPGWPIGPRDPDLGLEHAMKAVAINATFPPNQIALGEALRETGSESESREAYLRALDLARRKAQGGAAEASEWIREAEEALQRGQRD